MKQGKKYKNLVIIEWEDSHKTEGWLIGHSSKCQGLQIVSVGFLIAESKQAVVISAHKSLEEEPQYCNAMTIPRRSIKKITEVKRKCIM